MHVDHSKLDVIINQTKIKKVLQLMEMGIRIRSKPHKGMKLLTNPFIES